MSETGLGQQRAPQKWSGRVFVTVDLFPPMLDLLRIRIRQISIDIKRGSDLIFVTGTTGTAREKNFRLVSKKL